MSLNHRACQLRLSAALEDLVLSSRPDGSGSKRKQEAQATALAAADQVLPVLGTLSHATPDGETQEQPILVGGKATEEF